MEGDILLLNLNSFITVINGLIAAPPLLLTINIFAILEISE